MMTRECGKSKRNFSRMNAGLIHHLRNKLYLYKVILVLNKVVTSMTVNEGWPPVICPNSAVRSELIFYLI